MTHRIASLGSLALLLVASCDYEAPLNPDYHALNTISGTILANGVAEPGITFVFVFDAKNPPPPVGTGSPVTFSAVPASAYTTDGAGVKSAAYAIPYLADTTEETGYEAGFLVTALMDIDHNFSSFADILGGSTCGDWLGEHKADLTSLYPEPVFVENGELKDDVTIVISRQNTFQRPAFTLANTDLRISKQIARESLLDKAGKTQTYRVLATGVHTEIPAECPEKDDCQPISLDLPGPCTHDPAITDEQCSGAPACTCPLDQQEPCVTGFPVHFVDKVDNATGEAIPDGFHDLYPAELQAANELRDTWPRVYLEYQGLPASDEDGNLIFENELGEFEWPPGTGRIVKERWAAENYPLALELNFLGPALLAPAGSDPFSTFLAKELNLTFSPAFRHYHENGKYGVDPANGPWDLYDLRCYPDPGFGDGQFPSGDPNYQHPATCVDNTGDGVLDEVTLDDVPSGVWRFTVITEPGQTWRMPNEIGLPAWAMLKGMEEALVSTAPEFDVASQGVYLTLE